MDLLDRLLGHDTWTTQLLLARCRELSDAQLDQPFDIGNGTLRSTLVHTIGNIETWTRLMAGEPSADRERDTSVEGLIARHERAASDFAALARRIADEGRLDDLWLDTLDNPPQAKTYGGAIAHVILHDMHHRAEVLHILARLGLRDLPEGDLLSWEQAMREQHR